MQLFSMAFDEGDCVLGFKRCLFEYNGRQFMMYPGDKNYHMTIDTITKDEDDKAKAFKEIHEFLYLFGWENNFSFQYLGACSMTANKALLVERNVPLFKYPRRMRSITELIWMASSNCSEDIKKMLSLYNDARHTDNEFYKFLCLFKVLDYYFSGDRDAIKAWINAAFDNLILEKEEFIKSLKSRPLNMGYYLYSNLRNAIAHAHLGSIERGKDGMLSYNVDDYAAVVEGNYILDKLIYKLIENEIGDNKAEVIKVIFQDKE